MKRLTRKDIHTIFRAGVMVKAVDGTLELIVGIVLSFVGYEGFRRAFLSLGDGDETFLSGLMGWLSAHVINGPHGILIYSRSFWATLLIIHGVAKLSLVIGLLREKKWAYPAAAAVFSLFVIYQIYRFISVPSLFLAAVTLFDMALIALIIHEYRARS